MRIALLLILPFWLVPSFADEPPHLIYQHINVLVAHHDNRFSLRVWPDGRAEMRFPAYAVQAGQYRWQLSPDEQQELEARFNPLFELDLDGLSSRMDRRRSDSLTEVADADWLRLEIRTAERAPVELMLESPDAWQRALPELEELARLAELQADIFAWMQQSAQEVGQ